MQQPKTSPNHISFVFVVFATLAGQVWSLQLQQQSIHHWTINDVGTTNMTRLGVAYDFLTDLNRYLKETQYRFYLNRLEHIDSNISHSKADNECLQLLRYALANPLQHQWTAKMLDSSGSLLGSGLFSGTYSSLGDFDSCLAINDLHLANEIPVQGKYCLATTRLPRYDDDGGITNQLPKWIDSVNESSYKINLAQSWADGDVRFPLTNSLCLPKICDAKFIQRIILASYKPLEKLNFSVDYCQDGTDFTRQQILHRPMASIFVCCVLGLIFCLTLTGSVLELWKIYFNHSESEKATIMSQEDSTAEKMLTSFSLISNIRDLFNFRPSSYPWMDGLRCFLTILAFFSHVAPNQSVMQFARVSPFARFPEDYIRQSATMLNRYLVNSSFGVKCYFVIGGFLLAINTVKKPTMPTFTRHFLVRWMRFTPSLLGYIALTFVLSFLGNGPLFHPQLIEPYVRPCLQQLWMQLLYINNWFDFRYSCGFQTWYISADVQLYLLAYLPLFFLHRNKWFATYFISITFITISYIVPLIIFATKLQGLPFFLSALYPQLPIADRGYLLYWSATYNHTEAYFFGLLVGVAVAKKINIRISSNSIRLLWIISMSLILIMPQTFPWMWKDPQTRSLTDLVDSHSWLDVTIMTSAHTLATLSLCWIIYSASMHYTKIKPNIMIRFLSMPIFIPFARICFCVYLVHVPFIWFNVHQSRSPQMRDEFGVVQFSVLTFVYSLLAAVLIHLLFEAPFSKVVRHFFSWYDCRQKEKACKIQQQQYNNNNNHNADNKKLNQNESIQL